MNTNYMSGNNKAARFIFETLPPEIKAKFDSSLLYEYARRKSWEEKEIADPHFKDLYRKDRSDETIYKMAQQKKDSLRQKNDSLLVDPEGVFLDPKRYEQILKTTGKARNLLPTMQFPFENREYSWRLYKRQAEAKEITAGSTDIPMVSASVEQNYATAVNYALGYTLNDIEITETVNGNVSIEKEYQIGLRRGFDEFEDKVSFHGNSKYGVEGLFSNSNISPVPSTWEIGGSNTSVKFDSTSTQSNQLEALRQMTLSIAEKTNDRYGTSENPLILLLPRNQHTYLNTTTLNEYKDKTLMQHILEGNAYGIKEIKALIDCKGAAQDGSDVAFLYPYDETVISFLTVDTVKFAPIRVKDFDTIYSARTKTGGVVIRYPEACLNVYGV